MPNVSFFTISFDFVNVLVIISLWRSLDFIKIYTSVSQNLYHHFAHFYTSIRLDDGVA